MLVNSYFWGSLTLDVMDSVDLSPILEASLVLQDSLSDESLCTEERRSIVEQHIEFIEHHHAVKIPDFKPGSEWINTSAPLSLHNHLKGKVVLLDFFTYCCVNCLHLLPYLASLEKRFTTSDGLVVIGVHSAKFDNEKMLDNVISAVLRHSIHHPVVNDAETFMWNALSINCWPTLVLLGPDNQPLVILMGESHGSSLDIYIEAALRYYSAKDQILPHSIPLRLLRDTSTASDNLSFPGKISINDAGDLLVISDTGNHRILIVSTDGVVKDCVGCAKPGLQDGSFEEAAFYSPQGVAWYGSSVIYVADTENHAIRQVNVDTRQVLTVAGNGAQGSDKVGGQIGIKQTLNSPWDVCIGSSIGSNAKDVVFIAMAGLHQIWALFLKDGQWLKNVTYTKDICVCVAGSGVEENRNNAYPLRAGFAQPSGIACIRIGSCSNLVVSDSESSTIRLMSLSDGSVKGLVGGEKDPKNLFAFGDVDGTGIEAKLQHPLGIAWNAQEALIYVADSYNHKLKVIDLSMRKCTTFAKRIDNDTRNQQNCVSLKLNEPGGLCFNPSGSNLYVVDTNNHEVKTIDLVKGVATKFQLSWYLQHVVKENMVTVDGPVTRFRPKPHTTVKLNPVTLHCEGQIRLKMDITLEESIKLTPDAPQTWRVYISGDDSSALEVESSSGTISSLAEQPYIIVSSRQGDGFKPVSTSVEVEINIYFCSLDGDQCCIRNLLFQVPVAISNDGSQLETVLLKHHIIK